MQYVSPPGLPASATEKAATAMMMKVLNAPPAPDAKYVAYRTLPQGYDGARVFLATQRAIFHESGQWEARTLGLSFHIPIFIFQGEHDINTPTAVAREYFDEIFAPRRVFAVIPGAGHNPAPFHDEMLALLVEHVLPVVQNENR